MYPVFLKSPVKAVKWKSSAVRIQKLKRKFCCLVNMISKDYVKDSLSYSEEFHVLVSMAISIFKMCQLCKKKHVILITVAVIIINAAARTIIVVGLIKYDDAYYLKVSWLCS